MSLPAWVPIKAPVKAPSKWLAAAVLVLIIIFWVELLVPAKRQSQIVDEGAHIFSGYSYWTKGDFGMNPEHPPLVKLLATFPLLHMDLHVPQRPSSAPFFKYIEFFEGKQFLYSNDADAILFRARVAVSLLSIALALVIFFATREMFGMVPALAALVLCVFEPNLIAHGALVTTDMGMAMFLFATVYAFYRYAKKPTAKRLAVAAVLAGLTLATKHSGVLLCPILGLLAIAEILRAPAADVQKAGGRAKQITRLAMSLAVMAIVGVTILWAIYGFRYQARPAGLEMTPSLPEYVGQLEHHPAAGKVVLAAAKYHLLPESYLFGLTDVYNAPRYLNSFLFGNLYHHGQWFYFPAVFVIKSTLGFLLLLLLLPIAVALCSQSYWREFLFLSIPPAIYFLTAMASGFNIGVRHILPIYPFLIVLAAFVAGELIQKNKIWTAIACALILFHVVSSLRVFPNYLTYANEMWGGPAKTYKLLTNSNVDWGQQLKDTKKYLDRNNIKDCWFDYFDWPFADPSYYGIPCKPLPAFLSQAFEIYSPPSEAKVNGTVLISADELSGEGWGPDELNPYAQFWKLKPADLIDNSVLVFHGNFDLSDASAKNYAFAAMGLMKEKRYDDALVEAQAGAAADPNDVASQTAMCRVLMHLGRKDEAHEAYLRGVALANAVHPEYQGYWLWLLDSSGAK